MTWRLRHDYAVGGNTGWHRHPGPVFITVKTGTLTFYEWDDPECTPHVVSAGRGYVDTGRGHYGVNSGGVPATDVSVIIAPATPLGGPPPPFRIDDLSAPNPYCGF